MKKIIIGVVILAVVTVAVILITRKKDDTVPPADTFVEEEFIQTRDDTEWCYFSYFGKSGFDSYILSFPNAWIEKTFGEEYLSDGKAFFDKTDAALTNMASSRLDDYGDAYHFEFKGVSDEDISGEAFEDFKAGIAKDGVDKALVLKAVKATYTLTYYKDETKAETLSQHDMTITLFYLKGEGWYVAPDNYLPIVF